MSRNTPPHDPRARLADAVREEQAGRLKDAERHYRAALKACPSDTGIRARLGNLLLLRGQPQAALPLVTQAVREVPHSWELQFLLARVHLARKHPQDALEPLQWAAEQAPGTAAVHAHLGMLYFQLDRIPAAIDAMEQAVASAPDNPEFPYNLGIFLRAAGRLTEARDHTATAVRLKPDFHAAHYNLGNVQQDMGDHGAAVLAYTEAVRLQPKHAASHASLGHAQVDARQIREAIASYRQALALDPGKTEVHCLLSHQYRRLLDWPLAADHEATVLAQLRHRAGVVQPYALTSMHSSAEQQWQCARDYIRKNVPGPAADDTPPPRNTPSRAHVLTIGYLSADFRTHPVGMLMAGLLPHHDAARFHIRGYGTCTDDGGRVRKELIAASHAFTDLHTCSGPEAARRIRADGVDILVDLTGYTRGARVPILAARPAPVQVSFLGYAGTMGADFMDYVIADAFVFPEALEPFFSEQPARLPHSFLPGTASFPTLDTPPTRSDLGLPESGFIFCAFGGAYKIVPPLFDTWMDILRVCPASTLWLSQPEFTGADALRDAARERGIDPERLVFAPKMPDFAAHLARYQVADLFLDTLPYNAHSTALDAMYGGCPVLTCAGSTFAARVAGSLVQTAGIPELITHTLAEYRTVATELAHDPERATALRARMVAARADSPLFDGAGYTRHLEAAFETMWARHAAGKPPAAFQVTAT